MDAKNWLRFHSAALLVVGAFIFVVFISFVLGVRVSIIRPGVVPADPVISKIFKNDAAGLSRLLSAQPGRDLDLTTYSGMSLLMMAVEAGSAESVTVLLDHGADPGAPSLTRYVGDGNMYSPFAIAVVLGDIDVFLIIREHQSFSNITDRQIDQAREFLKYVRDEPVRKRMEQELGEL